MADCFALDVDDLHRRWLPREIFADIGIADAAPPSAAAVEDVAAHLTGILGGKEGAPRPPPPPPPPGPASHHHHHQYHQAAQVRTRLLGRRRANVQVFGWLMPRV